MEPEGSLQRSQDLSTLFAGYLHFRRMDKIHEPSD
jgi:hypothetical protein